MNDSVSKSEQGAARDPRLRAPLVAILIVATLPVVAAYVMFFTGVGVPEHTVNNGTLIKALSVEPLVPESIWKDWQQNKRWHLLLPMPAICDDACENSFYTTRQVHIRLGEKGERIRRIAVNYGGAVGEARLEAMSESHPLLETVSVSPELMNNWFAKLDPAVDLPVTQHFYFLVDQEGHAMMLYRDEHGNDLLSDIKRALKYSIDYQN